MVSVSFIGDIMLGRFVADKFRIKEYEIVDKSVVNKLLEADVRIANLESPIVTCTSDDSLRFAAEPLLLKYFKWIDCFSLSNNHINDFGNDGMKETIKHLDNAGIAHNGLYSLDYSPYLIERNGEKIAIIMCTDMMNYEFADDCPYKTLRMNKPEIIFNNIIKYRKEGYFVVIFLHAGMLFSRYLNPIVRQFAHKAVDNGAGAVITTHSHCLGGYEIYNQGFIFNSLGDFLMDGASFRRRQSCILNLTIEDGKLNSWDLTPTITTNELQTTIPDNKVKDSMLESCMSVAHSISSHINDYNLFYTKQYKREMLQHSLSTLQFEFKRRGLPGLLKIIWVRLGDVVGMIKRVATDRSQMSYDVDAVKSNSNKAIK